MIGQTVNTWQLFLQLQDGGGRHPELWLLDF